ncbi:MAG: FAD-dependent oxidoreductase [Desulfobacterales bacterium]|nr:FAD-dependent oxidoreductase [Desulfobacterales bacterium]MDX2509484.1 FAD-dependent oxidoreductase [Desulfobacterales bacterium]
MDRMFSGFTLGNLKLNNRFVFPPIKTAYGNPKGVVTDRQLTFYKQIALNGPGIIILEPASVTPEGREHPKQLCIHLKESVSELKKIVDAIHTENRLACIHLNHAGAAANPKATGTKPKAPSDVTCPTSGQTSEPLTEEEIKTIIAGYKSAAEKAKKASFDIIEIQAGHGYLISQFLNKKINKRTDKYGEDRLLFAREALCAVKEGAPDMPLIMRISGSEMSPEYGIELEDLKPLLSLAEKERISAIHVGMGSSCFSPPWYFHHASLPEKPQLDALSWVRENTWLPIIAAGRMGRKEKIAKVLDQGLADMIALGRPLIADPDLVDKWHKDQNEKVKYCGYCLQGCLHRLKNGEPLGCNLNPEIGLPELKLSAKPLKVLVAGGGPGGMSAALYLSRSGHKVTLAEKSDKLGGQFNLAWKAPGKQSMQEGLDNLEYDVKTHAESVMLGRAADSQLIDEIHPDLLVWATGAVQDVPEIKGLSSQYTMTSVEYFNGDKPVKGPRVLVIGAGRTGVEIAEKLGTDGYEIVATKRTDPIGSMMEMITKKLAMMRIDQLSNVTLMPHTTVKEFQTDSVIVEQDGEQLTLEPFQTVILSSGMMSALSPDESIQKSVANIEVIGDAKQVQDIFSAVHAGYELAQKYE